MVKNDSLDMFIISRGNAESEIANRFQITVRS
jgi:hypothetical protein